ncbi:MAG: LLM class flavin-dependent oxidoreductase [Acidimicrobiales bacterium]
MLLSSFSARWPQLRDAALAAEALGAPRLWTLDHLSGAAVGAAHSLECFAVLGALAAATSRIGLGALVANVTNRPAPLLAAAAATLAETSGGRFTLGLGAGARPGSRFAREREALGLPVPEPAAARALLASVVADLRRLWGPDAPAGVLRPSPPPPLVIGVNSSSLAAAAAALGLPAVAPAGHPRLEEIAAAALELWAYAPLEDAWLDPASPERRRLDRVGVARLIVVIRAPHLVTDIERVARPT